MNIKQTIIGAGVVFIGLMHSCSLPSMTTEETKRETAEDYQPTKEQYYEQAAAEGGDPILIYNGKVDRTMYVGLSNPVHIVAEGSDASHLKVYTNGGRLDTIDKAKGIYNLKENQHGFGVEVIAKNMKTGKVASQFFDVVKVPAPTAMISKYRANYKKTPLDFTAETLKAQDAVVLFHDDGLPVRCAAISYTITRVGTDGKKEVVKNDNRTGMFVDAAQQLIQKAQKGDLYIVTDIKTACSDGKVKNIVYELK